MKTARAVANKIHTAFLNLPTVMWDDEEVAVIEKLVRAYGEEVREACAEIIDEHELGQDGGARAIRNLELP